MRRLLSYCLIMAVVLLAVLATSPTGTAESSVTTQSGGARERIAVTLTADGAPAPGGTATLRFEATPLLSAPDLRVRWIVPAGVALLGDAEDSLGAVAARQSVTVERQIRFPAAGTYRIAVEAAYEPGVGIRAAASNILFFTIQEPRSNVAVSDPDARSPMGSIVPTDITVEADAAARAPNGDPCFNISGSLMRIDKPVTSGGYSANRMVPMRTALVTIREEDTLFDDEYGVVQVGVDGSFTFPEFCDDDGFLNDELELYIHIRAESWLQTPNNSYKIAVVEDSSYIDEVYEFKSNTQDSDGGNLRFDLAFDEGQSATLNILDTLYDGAKYFWETSGGTRPPEAEIHWEPGYGSVKSEYISFWEEITIADAPGDPDAWDDTVILHEYGHQLDDEYSCDESPGGAHDFTNTFDPELAWSEGYPDYWQSAVRSARGDAFGMWYLDVNGAGGAGGINLETITSSSTVNSIQQEAAIAGALWDLNDPSPAGDDGQDRVGYGHGRIQGVFINDAFEEMDNCNWDTFERAWMQLGNPADGPTAAAIVDNVGETELDGTPRPPLAQDVAHTPGGTTTSHSVHVASNSDWWNKVVSVVDTSASMAGPKFNAVKTVLAEQVNDLAALPEGTELSLETFDNSGSGNRTVFAGRFYPNDILPVINALQPSGAADTFCPINGLGALASAIQERHDHHAWLFTDGIQYGFPGAETVKQMLAERNVHVSIALLGLCPPVATTQAPDGVLAQPLGIARAYLGLAADETPGGLVPYLITAIASGGQFLFVDESQAEFAADILRAQITHSAGAGRWSDYVSDDHTYRYDRLTSWEYEWRDPTAPDIVIDPDQAGIQTIELPQEFPFYGSPGSTVGIFQHGYVTIEATPNFAGDADWPANREVPDPFPPLDSYSWPHRALYPYWDDLGVVVGPNSGPTSPAAPDALFGIVYGKRHGDWYAITYAGFRAAVSSSEPMTFQILLNLQTGEIRYQYSDVRNGGAGSATIGLEGNSGFGSSNGLQVSYNDVAGAADNSGYKFTPAPPQPTKSYPVSVDSMMQGVGFLLTGYSGSFDPLVVRGPDGNTIPCNASGVLCLNLGLVQYVQINVNGRVGEWNAEVSAGPTGSGTFSFTSFAASALQVRSQGDHSLSTSDVQPLTVYLGQPVDGNQLSGFFRSPNGSIFSGGFELHDDGQHGDGAAGDGLFGAPEFTPTRSGTAYLGVQGTVDGESFTRFDPAPFTFNPMRVYLTAAADNFGGSTVLNVSLQNQDSVAHCYEFTLQLPDGWFSNQVLPACIGPGEFYNAPWEIWLRFWQEGDNTFPSGTSGTVTVTATEQERGIMSDSATSVITRRREPALLDIHSSASWLRPGGDMAELEILVLDEQNTAVADGTFVNLDATLGTISPTLGIVQGGRLYATFTSGPATGTATITARTDTMFNFLESTVSIEIQDAAVNDVTLTVAPDTLPSGTDAFSQLTATVRDEAGEPVSGQSVRIGVEDDGQWVMIDGSEAITATTDGNGRVVATVRRRPEGAVYRGEVGIRAELLVSGNVIHEARVLLRLGEEQGQIFLPLVRR